MVVDGGVEWVLEVGRRVTILLLAGLVVAGGVLWSMLLVVLTPLQGALGLKV